MFRLSKIFLILFSLISISSLSYAAGTTTSQTMSCPTPPSAGNCDNPDNLDVTFPCPSGWARVNVNPVSGVYECAYEAGIQSAQDLNQNNYVTCTYVNTECKNRASKANNSVNMGIFNFGSGLTTEDGTTINDIPGFLIALATFDNKVLEQMEHMTGQSMWGYFASVFRTIKEKAYLLAIIVVMLGMIYALSAWGYKESMERMDKNNRSPFDIHVSDTLVRFGIAFIVFTFPVAQMSGGSGGSNYTTFGIEVFRKVLLIGNDVASEISDYANFAFAKYALFKNGLVQKDTYNVLYGSLDDREKNAIAILKQWNDMCESCLSLSNPDGGSNNVYLYNISDPKVRDNIRLKSDNATFNGGLSCKDYSDAVINSCVKLAPTAARAQSDLQEIADLRSRISLLNNPSSLTSTAGAQGRLSQLSLPANSNLQQLNPAFYELLKKSKDNQIKYGWMNTFVSIFPAMTLSEYITLPGKSEEKKDTWGSDGEGKGKFETVMTNVAKIGLILSLPPGKDIFNMMNGIYTAFKDWLKDASDIKLPVIGSIAGMVVKRFLAIADLAVYPILLFISYIMASTILKLIPLLTVIMFGSIRLIMFFIEVAKATLVLPFISVWALTLRNKGKISEFLNKTIVLTLTPLLFTLSVVLSIFALELFQWLVFIIPVDALNMVESSIDVSANLLDKIPIYIVLYSMKAGLFIINIVGSTIIGYKIIMNGVDWFLQLFGRVEGLSEGISKSVSTETTSKVTGILKIPV